MDKELLYRFFRNETSREEAFAVQEWAESSPEANEEFFSERQFFDALTLLPELHVAKQVSPMRRWMRRAMQAAAILLAGITGAWLWHTAESRFTDSDNVITVAEGQRARLTLSDGTEVWLNSGSTLRYPTAFGNRQRTVELDGEGYFEVAHNERKPFVVQTLKADVEVLGTKFNLDAYASESRFEAALFEGAIRLYETDGNANVVLRPDQKALLTDNGFHIEPLGDRNVYLWRDGIIYFRDASFGEIMEKFEKYFGVEIVVNNPQLRERNYTGKFRQIDGLDYALEVLNRDASFTVFHDKEHRRITIE